MQTRPNPDDDTERYVLASPIVTNALKIEGNTSDTGDSFFSVSEIQAFGDLVIEFTKEISGTIEAGDMDGVLETGETWIWELRVVITNVSGETIHIGKVHDRVGGDLESDWMQYTTVLGPLDMYTRGKTEKVFYDFEGDFDLLDGASVNFKIWVSPDVNTGTGNGKKPGKQEYTSPGEHCLNSGAWLEGWIGDEYFETSTNPVCVDVVEYIEGPNPD
jgi:hypothetical protein